jgi:hypothetical protein
MIAPTTQSAVTTAMNAVSKTAVVVVKAVRFVVGHTESSAVTSAVRAAPIAIVPKASAALANVVPPVSSVFGPVMIRVLCVATHVSRTKNVWAKSAVMGHAPGAARTVTA